MVKIKMKHSFVDHLPQPGMVVRYVVKYLQCCLKGGIKMTANQIAYNRQREEVRHNAELEKQGRIHLAHEHATAGASVKQAEAAVSQAGTAALSQKETARHNAQQEQINWWYNSAYANEMRRHNMEGEAINRIQVDNLHEYQLAQGQAALRQAAVSERQASVAERNATTQERELENSRLRSQASYLSAQAGWVSAQANQMRVTEEYRHNRVQESIQSQAQRSEAKYRNASARTAYLSYEDTARDRSKQRAQKDTELTQGERRLDQQQTEVNAEAFRDVMSGFQSIGKFAGDLIRLGGAV
nr:putative ORF1 [Marmot picobirnavirus]